MVKNKKVFEIIKEITKPITDYQKRMLNYIKKCKNNKELLEVIDKIYGDGFSDGSMNPNE